MSLRSRLCTGHPGTEHFFARYSTRHLGDDFSAIHDRDAIAEREDLVQLGTHEQNGLSGASRGTQLIVNEFDRVAVMYRGKIVTEMPRSAASEEVLGPWMTGAQS